MNTDHSETLAPALTRHGSKRKIKTELRAESGKARAAQLNVMRLTKALDEANARILNLEALNDEQVHTVAATGAKIIELENENARLHLQVPGSSETGF